MLSSTFVISPMAHANKNPAVLSRLCNLLQHAQDDALRQAYGSGGNDDGQVERGKGTRRATDQGDQRDDVAERDKEAEE